jgi:hypothetical protein
MAASPSRWRSLAIIGVMAIFGGCVGFCAGAPASIFEQHIYPLPHHFPHYPDGVSLRFAMAHDVIHERYPWHGPAYFEERNRLARKGIKEEESKGDGKPTPRYWDLVDDLAVGLDRIGKHEEAVTMMRDKLQRQQALGMTGRDLYSSYANLGTLLILWQIDEGFGDKAKAKERVGESIDLIHKAVEVKPDAHFGREMWQSVLEEFLLASLDFPEVILEFDMIGDRLDQAVDPGKLRAFRDDSNVGTWQHRSWEAYYGVRNGDVTPTQAARFRDHITRVGAEQGWPGPIATEYMDPVPFDEPTLGIIGMWRYGGGANPHFALALGEIMLRVGQRYIAWTAYERSALIAAKIGLPEKYVEHCRKRQTLIESQLPPAEVAKLRPRFEKELAFGQRYQKEYQDYEARRIRDGASIDDPHFYDDFNKEHGDIASPVGEEDQYVVKRLTYMSPKVTLATVALGAGILAFLTSLIVVARSRRKKVTPTASDSSSQEEPET